MTSTSYVDAILLACWPAEDQLWRDLGVNPALIQMGDKPMLQRALEKLVELGCRRITVVHGDRPEGAQDLIGDGQRWGCEVTHRYASADATPLRSIVRVAPPGDELCVLAAAETVPLRGFDRVQPAAACTRDGYALRWAGWATLPGRELRALAGAAADAADLARRIIALPVFPGGRAAVVPVLSTGSPGATIGSLPRLFAAPAGADGISWRPREPGVWIGNGSQVRPSAQLRPPVFLGRNVLVGEHAQIGPNAVIGDGCIIDSESRVKDSVVLPHTYLGRRLELAQALLKGSELVNARLAAGVRVADPGMACDITGGDAAFQRTPLAQRVLAGLLFAALAPVARLASSPDREGDAPRAAAVARVGQIAGEYRSVPVGFALTYAALREGGAGAWKRHFFSTFIPGLREVLAGRLALVGLQPRSVEEVFSLPYHWQQLYRSIPIGLLTEAMVDAAEPDTPEERFAADALCGGAMPLARVLRVLWRYTARVTTEILTRRRHRSGSPGRPVPQSTP